LVNAIERAIAAALSAPTLFQRHLPSSIRVKLAQGQGLPDQPPVETVAPAKFPRLKDLREATYTRIEKKYMEDLLKFTAGDVEQACLIADLSRTRFYEILRKHRISVKS